MVNLMKKIEQSNHKKIKLLASSDMNDIIKEEPQRSFSILSVIKSLLNTLPQKWQNYLLRSLSGFLMISGFTLIIYLGPLALMIMTLCIQVKCFQEIIDIGYSVYKIHGLPWFRSLSWYMLLTSNYFFYGESMVDYFSVLLHKSNFLSHFVAYHRLISFTLFLIGLMWFVLSLVKKYYMRQFSLFAWTHFTLLIIVTQCYLLLQNLFEGLIWYLVPVSMIICNDLMAYMFGFFFGKTPLIKLSPKKTWEGFIGGGVMTVIFGLILSHILCQYKYFTCPIEYSEYLEQTSIDCVPSPLFQLTEYHLPILSNIIPWEMPLTVTLYPFVLHSISLSLFCSIIGPFGGFFASGFKRAFKVKDFGDLIPGHGGVMDRFDCMYLMATFVNVYISSFIRAPKASEILSIFLRLKESDRIQVFELLRNHLKSTGVYLINEL